MFRGVEKQAWTKLESTAFSKEVLPEDFFAPIVGAYKDIQLKGQDHYVFIKENGKAQVIYDEGRWVTEHIRTAVLKFNYEIDKIDKLLVKDFTDEEIREYEKTS